ncbi:zinc finger protein [Anaeramoeba flamelloides]|uniref:Zinc finger protein n=1 Tax=Anaeramoeba flamelloides TaxID=1746091 RepID=A0ABQ8XE34_9EUKA|nr:zinc finger protein [Anaeramoeba flamelloides]
MENQKYQCNLCLAHFVSQENIIEHMLLNHNVTVPFEGNKPNLDSVSFIEIIKQKETKKENNKKQSAKEILDEMIKIQQKERNSKFSKKCLYCREVLNNRKEFFEHLYFRHKFNIGKYDNLVLTDEFIQVIKEYLDKQQCIFCKKIFPNIKMTTTHMRKKRHYRINPKDKRFDKFYMKYYLKNCHKEESQYSNELSSDNISGSESGLEYEYQNILNQENNLIQDENEDNWEDSDDNSIAQCLFCEKSSSKVELIFQHMNEIHNFELNSFRKNQNLNFYQTVKIINYIRLKIREHNCPVCDKNFKDNNKLLNHLHLKNHVYVKIDKNQLWNDEQFLIPILENDLILQGFCDDSEFSDDDEKEDQDKKDEKGVEEEEEEEEEENEEKDKLDENDNENENENEKELK